MIPVAVPTQDSVLGAFTRLGELAVDGVIVIMEVHLLDAATVSLPPNVHVVVVDSDAGDRYTVVDTDQADGARQAVRHLLDLGHRTVWHVAGPAESFAAGRREQAWHDTLTAAGARVPPPLRGDWSAQSGYQAGLRLAASQPGHGAPNHAQVRGGADNADESDCTAVFVANDQMALGVLRALHEQGIDVPGRMSVVGFDDIDDAASFIPPLTTVHQDFAEVGRACVQAVLDQIAAGPGDGPTGTTLVPTRLVVRASTAPPPGGPPGARR